MFGLWLNSTTFAERLDPSRKEGISPWEQNWLLVPLETKRANQTDNRKQKMAGDMFLNRTNNVEESKQLFYKS